MPKGGPELATSTFEKIQPLHFSHLNGGLSRGEAKAFGWRLARPDER